MSKFTEIGAPPKSGNPYRGLAPHQFWSRSVSTPCFSDIDPVVRSDLKIDNHDKVATLGSCFAQHLARHLSRSGLNYFVPESGDHLDPEKALANGYGVFSARYANVYTVSQALQLFDRAFGKFKPKDSAWALGDRFVDPFRPQVEPGGFESVAALEADRVRHLAAVRRVFLESQVIVFTMGLTEAWRSKRDGATFPSAPGVAGGDFDPARYEFVNFDVRSVTDDLTKLCKKIRQINPGVRILLTVSPVPLIATYEDRHVLVSTIASKSVLRVAADEASRALPYVTYFPSYEIITGPGSNYFEDDLRQVSDLGVQHVMRMFERHYFLQRRAAPMMRVAAAAPVVCDEEILDEAS
jgi:hypothetical protein